MHIKQQLTAKEILISANPGKGKENEIPD